MTTFFRVFWIIPILIILGLISGSGQTITNTVFVDQAGEVVKKSRTRVERRPVSPRPRP